MLDLVQATVRPLMLDEQVLEVAYRLYLKAPKATLPTISIQALVQQTGKSPLQCRNAIVEANSLGRFPDCELHP
ncbi:MAG: hypothetical protein EA342_14200 [Leptolyngbya sp. LCM1.Bin17]|nr:MAG: hypothetical protein EA342_14200 [Leptolyngbya sp. LCM1.Bin17]